MHQRLARNGAGRVSAAPTGASAPFAILRASGSNAKGAGSGRGVTRQLVEQQHRGEGGRWVGEELALAAAASEPLHSLRSAGAHGIDPLIRREPDPRAELVDQK